MAGEHKAVTPGANWRKIVIQLRTKPNSLETAGNRDEAIRRYHANAKGQEEDMHGW